MDINKRLQNSGCGDNRIKCEGCRQYCPPEKLIDGHFCSHCIEYKANEGWLCGKCGKVGHFKELDKNHYCIECRIECQFCGVSNVRIIGGACKDCLPENFDPPVICAICHDKLPARKMLFHKGQDICPSCLDKSRLCSRCRDTHPVRDMIWFNGDWYCQNCMEVCRECKSPIPKDLPPAPGYCFNCLPF